jgi:hypothetical protein
MEDNIFGTVKEKGKHGVDLFKTAVGLAAVGIGLYALGSSLNFIKK